ncbi:hypothetical protein PISMIDRAFT_345246 [Pisolithus microcarpus 441]|uniref:Unplaced genomic scaffold scaffold_240, whole genome shotgun sequence n=1 Tax=Pisolithus microcarpus 441 TaxID=765257 RepID=A0A0C9YDI0_9AGAM|nr:hypothetical protein PISMIDRAFT_345246 [Pisolithus microcarpus 441]
MLPRPEASHLYPLPSLVPLQPNGYGLSAAPSPGIPADMPHYPTVVYIPRPPPDAVPTPPPVWPPQYPPPSAYAPSAYHSPAAAAREFPMLPPTMTTYVHPAAAPSMAPANLPRSMTHPVAAPSVTSNLPPTMTTLGYPGATPMATTNLPRSMTHPVAAPSVASNLPPTMAILGYPGAIPTDQANSPRGPPTPPLRAPPTDTARANVGQSTSLDHIDPFAKGPHYVPVIDPSLAGVLGSVIRINPLLAPPGDLLEPQLRWNMLFHPSHRTDSLRFWMKQHEAPATFPRLTYVRIISRSFPWMIQIDARDLTTGVTCGEILDGIFEYLYSDVTKDESENVSEMLKLHIFSSYEHNRSTDPNVPGGGLGVALKRLDWLGNNTMFGGLVLSDKFTMEDRGDIPPATFELKCLPNRPPTPQELDERRLPQKATRSTNGLQSTPSSSVTANEQYERPRIRQVFGSVNESQSMPSCPSANELQEQPWHQRATSTHGSQSSRSSLLTANELHEQGSLRQQVTPSPNESSQFPSSSPPTIQPQKDSLRQNATRSTHRSQSTGPPFSLELYITFDGNQSVRTYRYP